MPPRPGAIEAIHDATNTLPMLVEPVFTIRQGQIKGVQGVPSATKGSIVYPAVFSFGYLLTSGMITANRGRKGLRRTSRGGEDGRQSQG